MLSRVSMHLLVLSAFRRAQGGSEHVAHGGSQCTFWCSVVSDIREQIVECDFQLSQCTFWCSVLSDASTSRPTRASACLNAPSGAQCFPTFLRLCASPAISRSGLNAPSGAQCFPTENGGVDQRRDQQVSMHLLVLSAFRREVKAEALRWS